MTKNGSVKRVLLFRVVPVEEVYGLESVSLLLAHPDWDLHRLAREMERDPVDHRLPIEPPKAADP